MLTPNQRLKTAGLGVILVTAGEVARHVLQRTYITYVLTNPTTGQVYAGRASGYGTPNQVLWDRLSRHHMWQRGFTQHRIDVAAQGDQAYSAIRGREQQLLDSFGGVGDPQVANAIRGVAKTNPFGRFFHAASDNWFGNIAPYTGYF